MITVDTRVITPTRYSTVRIDQLPHIATYIKEHNTVIALDLETTGLNARSHKIVTMQFGTQKQAFILDVRSYYDDQCDQSIWKNNVQELLSACKVLVGHNLKFDLTFLAQHFDSRFTNVFDTMITELVIYGEGQDEFDKSVSVGMESTASRYGLKVSKELQQWSINLDQPRKAYTDGSYVVEHVKNGKQLRQFYHSDHTAYKSTEKVPEFDSYIGTVDHWILPLPDLFIQYCVQDVVVPLQLREKQLKKITELDLHEVLGIENACIPAIAKLEQDGVYIDRVAWQDIIDKKTVLRDQLQAEIVTMLDPVMQEIKQQEYEYQCVIFDHWKKSKETAENEAKQGFLSLPFGHGQKWIAYRKHALAEFTYDTPRPKTPKLDTDVINLGSHVQLKKVLAHLDIHIDKTDKEHLELFKREHESIEKLIEWKHLNKFLTSFGETLLEKIEADGRIHPSYKQLGAATGRMSCSNPNWQQIPAKEPAQYSVRKCVVAQEGNVILTCDLPNIELRILADIAKDERMLTYFADKDADLHSMTAMIMFNLPEGSNPKYMDLKPGLTYRSVAKTINFGLVYGMSAIRLAATLKIDNEHAQELMDTYFQTYPQVASWLEFAAQFALVNGYSLTLAGRKRFFSPKEDVRFNPEIHDSWEDFLTESKEARKHNGRISRQAKNAPIQGSNADITKLSLALLYKHMPSYVKFVTCVHDEVVLEVPQEHAEEVSKLFERILTLACKRYLHTVEIHNVDVIADSYWRKE